MGVVVLALLGLAAPVAGQRSPASDSTTIAEYRRILLTLRDTVDIVSARSAEFRRDLRTVGAGTVIARGRQLARACGSVREALRDSRPAILRLPVDARGRAERDSLTLAMRALEHSLETECLQGLNPEGPGERADTLRAWGPNRTANLGLAITAYHGAAARLARRLRIDLTRY